MGKLALQCHTVPCFAQLFIGREQFQRVHFDWIDFGKLRFRRGLLWNKIVTKGVPGWALLRQNSADGGPADPKPFEGPIQAFRCLDVHTMSREKTWHVCSSNIFTQYKNLFAAINLLKAQGRQNIALVANSESGVQCRGERSCARKCK